MVANCSQKWELSYKKKKIIDQQLPKTQLHPPQFLMGLLMVCQLGRARTRSLYRTGAFFLSPSLIFTGFLIRQLVSTAWLSKESLAPPCSIFLWLDLEIAVCVPFMLAKMQTALPSVLFLTRQLVLIDALLFAHMEEGSTLSRLAFLPLSLSSPASQSS